MPLPFKKPPVIEKLLQTIIPMSRADPFFHTLLELIKRVSEPKVKDPDKDLTWKLNNLERQLKEVQRALR